MPSPRTNMSDKLRVLFDTTVFCGALVKPDGGNMRCLLLANAPFFDRKRQIFPTCSSPP